MNLRNYLIGLSMVVILAPSVPSVVAKPTGKLATETHNTYKYATDQPAQQKDMIVTPGTLIPPPRPTSGNQIRSSSVYLQCYPHQTRMS